jgi:hypothetical protein
MEKRARRDVALHLASRAEEAVRALYDELAARARSARRRSDVTTPVQGSPLLLDAAFLVPRVRAASFRALTVRHARAFAPSGCIVTLSGPWPPYSFLQD